MPVTVCPYCGSAGPEHSRYCGAEGDAQTDAEPGTRYLATVDGESVTSAESYDTARAAWYALYHERNSEECDYSCEVCNGEIATHGVYGDCDDDSENARALAQMAHHDEAGSIRLPAPGGKGFTEYVVREVTL